jgi:hypothetical protein
MTKLEMLKEWARTELANIGVSPNEIDIRFVEGRSVVGIRYMLEAGQNRLSLFLPKKFMNNSENQRCFLEVTFGHMKEAKFELKPQLKVISGGKTKKKKI